jgi:hypothetical protein
MFGVSFDGSVEIETSSTPDRPRVASWISFNRLVIIGHGPGHVV